MGMVIVTLSARFGGYDALPDPIGWILVVVGLLPLRDRLPLGGTALTLAALAGLVAVPLWLPFLPPLSASGQWAASLPQTAFCIVACSALATATERAGEGAARRLRMLRWAYVVVMVGPVLVYGGGLVPLTAPLAMLAVAANVVLVWQLFALSRRPYLVEDPTVGQQAAIEPEQHEAPSGRTAPRGVRGGRLSRRRR